MPEDQCTVLFHRYGEAVALKNEAVQTVLEEQGAIIQKIMTDGNIKCWGPDGTSSGACQVK